MHQDAAQVPAVPKNGHWGSHCTGCAIFGLAMPDTFQPWNQTLVRPAHPSQLLTFSYIADFWE